MAHVPHLYLPPPWAGETIALSDGHLHHLRRVLRVEEGDPLTYTDGQGVLGAGTFLEEAVIRGEEGARPRPTDLEVAVTPPRVRDRLRFLVEKLAELGIARLHWVYSRRTEGRPPPAGKAQAWVASALEQSRGAWSMELVESDLSRLDRSRLVVADPDGGDIPVVPGRILLVGPEGGFDEDELPPDAQRVSLGPTILRVETAAVVGAALLRAGGAASG